MKKAAIFFLIIGIICSVFNLRAQPIDPLLSIFINEYQAKISIHPSTNTVRSMQFPANQPFHLEGVNTTEKAWNFLNKYAETWGILKPEDYFSLKQTQRDIAGNEHLFFEQSYQTIPFFDGNLRFHFNNQGGLTSLNGVVFPTKVAMEISRFSITQVSEIALQIFNKNEIVSAQIIGEPSLQYYHTGLAKSDEGVLHLVYEVELLRKGAEHDFLYVSAVNGQLIAQLAASCHSLYREVHNTSLGGTLVWQEGDTYPGSLTTEQQSIVSTTGHAYYFFSHAFGNDSYDNNGAQMKTVSNAALNNCPNATWNGTSTNFCTGFGIDDVIGHEWGHAYTEYTSSLIYAWQAGALNESYSDIWGETIDLLNNYGNDTGDDNLRTTCNNSIRWRLGEEYGSGALRDMWDPNCKGDPGKVSDGSYYCGTGDSGGVHTNSGVPNHSYALLVDGGSYNGYMITGLGLTKAAHIFWQAQNQYLTRTSNFDAFADALEAACTDLLGVDLPALSTEVAAPGLSGEIITVADCNQLSNVISATELRSTTPCSFTALLNKNTPDLCPLVGESFQLLFSENFEGGTSAWVATEIPSNPPTWDSRNWAVSSTLPGGNTSKAMYGPDPFVGDCSSDLDNGIIQLESPVINVPANVIIDLYLTFDHYISMENEWDGGIVQYQINGGAWADFTGADFVFNSYNDNLRTAAAGNDNPLEGKAAFTGADGGSVAGSWGTSQLNLGALAGQSIRIRWQLGVDGCNGWDGWYLDNVMIGGCSVSALLPVSWLSFDVKQEKETVLLEWSTSQEQNNSGFWIERAQDEQFGFQAISWIEGRQNSNQIQRYTFIDGDVQLGRKYYYRLQQVDFDETIRYSPIRQINMVKDELVRVFPNPSNGQFMIEWPGESGNNIIFPLYDLNGRLVHNFRDMVHLEKGETLPLSTPKLTAGIYILVTTYEGQQYRHRLVINKN